MSKYRWPKELIERGSKVAIYGGGEVGQFLVNRNAKEQYCNVVCIFDSRLAGQILCGISVVDITDWKMFEFDYVLVGSVEYADEMIAMLHEKGIDDKKIVALSENHRIVRCREDIPYMAKDDVEESRAETFGEYVRYRCLELVCRQITSEQVPGDMAEAGVWMGDFARGMNALLPGRKLYLYDTFDGFVTGDIDIDLTNGYTSNERFGARRGISVFQREDMSSEEQIESIKQKMENLDNVYIRRGNFPDTAVMEEDKLFALVSLDMDLYRPTMDGLLFFWPRLAKGGYIFLHDYNAVEHSGIYQALADLESRYGKINKVPIPDEYGSVVLTK